MLDTTLSGTQGQYARIFNTDPERTVSLLNHKVCTSGGCTTITRNLEVPPLSCVLIVADATAATLQGYNAALLLSLDRAFMATSSDTIEIRAPPTPITTCTSLTFQTGTTRFPTVTKNTALIASSWSNLTLPWMAVSGGTPNLCNEAAPARCLGIYVVEIMNAPSGTDNLQEYFKIFNSYNSPINLRDHCFEDDVNRHCITVDVIIPARTCAAFGINQDTSTNGNVTLLYQYSGLAFSSNDYVEVYYPGFKTPSGDDFLCESVYFRSQSGDPSWPAQSTGSSLIKSYFSSDPYLGSSWTSATTTWPGSGGQRGAPNSCSPYQSQASCARGDLYFAEIMYNPGGSETAQEWVRIGNRGPTAVNLRDWKLYQVSPQIITANITADVVIPPNGCAILAETAFATNGGMDADFVYGALVRLPNNVGETIGLVDVSMAACLEVSYLVSASTGWPGSSDGYSIIALAAAYPALPWTYRLANDTGSEAAWSDGQHHGPASCKV